MTPPNPTLLTLLRRVEKLDGPEVPSSRTFDASRPISLQHSQVMVDAGIYAAVLRDQAAGPVVEWFEDTYSVDMSWCYASVDKQWCWSVNMMVDAIKGEASTREQAIIAALAAALEKVEDQQ